MTTRWTQSHNLGPGFSNKTRFLGCYITKGQQGRSMSNLWGSDVPEGITTEKAFVWRCTNSRELEHAFPTGCHKTGSYNSPLVGKDGPQVIRSHGPVPCFMFTFRARPLLLNLVLPICNTAIFQCLLLTSFLLLLSILFLPTQNLTKLKRLNLDGNQLTSIPALPSSLHELKLNDNNLAGLQRQSFRGMRPLTNCLFLG